MDHKEFITSLSAHERQRLTAKSDLPAFIHLGIHLGLILTNATLINLNVWGWQALMLIQGILLVFLFTLLHETLHATVFKTKQLNTLVGYLCGFLILIPPLWFRYFHFAHHRYTQDPENDPELASPKPETTMDYIVHISGLPTWYSQLKQLGFNAAGKAEESYLPAIKTNSIRLEGRIMLKLYVLLLLSQLILGSTLLLYTWIIPLLLGQPFLRLYLMAEHGRCPQVANMFLNTRTIFTNWFVRKLAWNMPYHAEHHAMPSVPYHALPRLHELTQEHLQSVSDGYIDFHKTYFDEH